MQKDGISGPLALGLRDIAAWFLPQKPGQSDLGRVGVPIFQRGLVWRPRQVEMLWDSLLRGFPVGALVLSPAVAGQTKEKDDGAAYHLLDGQQRCHAISLGYLDPFGVHAPNRDTIGADGGPNPAQGQPPPPATAPQGILWIDLNAKPQGTRKYIARLTTPAHPWGYGADDEASRLKASEMRCAVEAVNGCGDTRPSPLDLYPYLSTAPVPMAWLTDYQFGDVCGLVGHLSGKLADPKVEGLPWAKMTSRFLGSANHGDGESGAQMEKILAGLQRLQKARIVGLMVPPELVDGTCGIADIEQLFQRLNRNGTPLAGEELAYSMMKAYWPEMAGPIDGMKSRHMPASRFVSLAFRLARAANASGGQSRETSAAADAGAGARAANASGGRSLPPPPNIDQIREAARGKSGEAIRAFLAGGDNGGKLAAANARAVRWLEYSRENPAGFLPVQITRFAMGSPGLYLVVLWLAHTFRVPDGGCDADLAKAARAAISWGHWFAQDDAGLANLIYERCAAASDGWAARAAIVDALESACEGPLLPRLPPPKYFRALGLPESESMDSWDWPRHLIEAPAGRREARRPLCAILWQRDLVLYAQRAYLHDKFRGYDPSEKDMWQDHNCPWDYDHILANYYTYYSRDKFVGFAKKWVGTNGNLRALPSSENRSDQNDLASAKITKTGLGDSFMVEAELEAFSLGGSVTGNPDAAIAFANACWGRTIRIYEDWYNNIGMADFRTI